MRYTAAIIGSGNIGALKEHEDPNNDTAILTHAHAFSVHPDVGVVQFVDVDRAKADAACRKWPKAMPGIIEDPSRTTADIVSVCVQTKYHKSVMMKLLSRKVDLPKLVIVEKPFCDNKRDAIEVAIAYKQAGVPIMVNYTRRYCPTLMLVFSNIRNGVYGDVYHARVLYGRGLRRDGCHGIDVLNYTLGLFITGESFFGGCTDFMPDDPSLNIRMMYERCSDVQMQAVDSRKYGMFEIEFITEDCIITMHNWGRKVFVYAPEKEPFGNYKTVQRSAPIMVSTGMDIMFKNMVENAVDFLDGKAGLKCTALDAIVVHEVIEAVQ